ncbi:MAG: hypothetical protein IJM04_06180 [Prevotella sp.]|nr:hypothetical protein [Prevotella sp.]
MLEFLETCHAVLVGGADNLAAFVLHTEHQPGKVFIPQFASLLNAEKYLPKSSKSKLFSAFLSSTTSFS